MLIQMLPLLLALPLIAFWMWMFREMANNPELTRGEKNTWLLWFVLANVIAAMVYYAYIYRNR